MGIGDPLALLLDQKPQPQIVELCHPDPDDCAHASRAGKRRARGDGARAGVACHTDRQGQCPMGLQPSGNVGHAGLPDPGPGDAV